MTSDPVVAYLGPEGTFSHLVARKRFGAAARLHACDGIYEVFEHVAKGYGRLGIVPIENSSGGTISETVDCLIAAAGKTHLREELSLNVRLALLGRRGAPIRNLYSHFVPIQHSAAWIRAHLKGVQKHEKPSTARAAEAAAADPAGAALAPRGNAKKLGLDVLAYPVHSDVPNITEFAVIGRDAAPQPRSSKTSLLVKLENRPGSLFDFLLAFKESGVNLTRLISRPILGQPKSYQFIVDLQGTPDARAVKSALAKARGSADRLTILGVYPVRKMYAS